MNIFKPLYISEDRVLVLDQRLLHKKEKWLEINTGQEMASAISDMAVRGAPAIGIAGAYGVWLYAREIFKDTPNIDSSHFLAVIEKEAETLSSARPTAVNLTWAVNRMLSRLRHMNNQNLEPSEMVNRLKNLAEKIHEQDIAANLAMGEHGAELFGKVNNVLTHCNAGALATGGHGTALGVIYSAHRRGNSFHVWVDETRPYLQGARLTAWELNRAGVNCTLICDNMAGYLMKLGKVDAIITGADRIALNGDTANKIGTYSLAILAESHDIPFYVAAPVSTFDPACPDGAAIPVEYRSDSEVVFLEGLRIASPGVNALHPAFDVTPARLIRSFITERGLIRPDGESIQLMFDRELQHNAAQ